MANFCINCGTRLRKEDKYCINCGTIIDKSDIKQNNHLFKSTPDNLEKKRAKKELKRIIGGRILYNQTFVEELHINGLSFIDTRKAIKKQIEKEIDSGKIKSGGVEIRLNQLIHEYKIKNEEKIKIEREKQEEKRKMEEKKRKREALEIKRQREERERQEAERKRQVEEYMRQFGGGYCSSSCRYYYEEILTNHGVSADYTEDFCGVLQYCHLGYDPSSGSYCRDYEE